MIITELSYKFQDQYPFVKLDIKPGTGTFTEESVPSVQGDLITSTVEIYLPTVSDDHNKIVKDLTSYGAIFEIKVTDDNVYIIGVDELRTQFTYKKQIADKPGGKSGYNIKIIWKSLSGAKTL